MINPKTKILVADNERYFVQKLKTWLTEDGYEVVTLANSSRALEKLVSNEFAIFLTELKLSDIGSIELLSRLKEKQIHTQTIIITGRGTILSAVNAIKKGAFDYLLKPVEKNQLRKVVSNAAEHYQNLDSNKRAERKLHSHMRFDDIIGQSSQMLEVYRLIDLVADTTANVIITGESGTGKELVARAIHKKSSRSQGPFIAVNCSAFPRDILENELFGHEEGAFTGAMKQKAGCFELATEGTLMFDEICDMPLETQAKLLRALEERRFRRLGGKKEIAVDVRVISASNKKLEQAVNEKTLREDIYYRLSVFEIELPPLRERRGDIPVLMSFFLKLFTKKNDKPVKSFSPKAFEVLTQYRWPGNVRELRNTIERAVVLCGDATIQIKHLPVRIVTPDSKKFDIKIILGSTLDDAERELIFKTLDFVHNNKTKAAQVLKISLKTLHNKLNLYKAEKLN